MVLATACASVRGIAAVKQHIESQEFGKIASCCSESITTQYTHAIYEQRGEKKTAKKIGDETTETTSGREALDERIAKIFKERKGYKRAHLSVAEPGHFCFGGDASSEKFDDEIRRSFLLHLTFTEDEGGNITHLKIREAVKMIYE